MSLHYLIDGYNLIKRSSILAQKSLEDGRRGLISFIERYHPQGSDRNSVTIVFDGKPGMYGPPAATKTSLVFTEYESADDWIKAKVEDAGNKKELVVVTDDRLLLLYVRKIGAKVMSNAEFLAKAKDLPSRPARPASSEGKNISASFEHAVFQEFEKIWIKKPKD